MITDVVISARRRVDLPFKIMAEGRYTVTGELVSACTQMRHGHRSSTPAPADQALRSVKAQGAHLPSGARLLCYVILVIVAAPGAGSMPAPTGGGTHPVNLPAKRIPADIRSLCRAYTAEAVRSLAAIMRQADAPPGARIQAIAVLLDRGWGRAPQSHVGEDGNDIRVTIRKIVEGGDEVDEGLQHQARR